MDERRQEAIMQQAEASANTTGRPDKAAHLIQLATEAGIEIYLDQNDDPHITVPERPLVGIPIKSDGFKRWLSSMYYKTERKSFTSEIFSQVVSGFEGQAIYENNVIELCLRVAKVGHVFYYDLGDGVRAVEISDGAWLITEKCPVRFRRFPHQMAQVTPELGGNLSLLLEYFNLSSKHEALLLQTYVVSALVPNVPRANIILTGAQGAAKSTGLKVLRLLIDPSRAALLSPTRDPASIFETANQHFCYYLDNLSYVSDESSDAYCRLITGSSFSKRKLYTDSDQIVINLMVAVGMTGINLVANKADLLDRSLILNLERIPDDKRMDEETFWKLFEANFPKLLGAVFTTLAKAIEVHSKLTLSQTPRMADYARYAASSAIALGYTANDFLAAYGENTMRQNQAAVDASPTAQVTLKFMEDRLEWIGSSSDLYRQLEPVADALNLSSGEAGGFPRSAHKLWQRINVVRPNLLAAGIDVSHHKIAANSVISLRKIMPDHASVAEVATVATQITAIDFENRERIEEICLNLQETQALIEHNEGRQAEISQLRDNAAPMLNELESLGVGRKVSDALLTFHLEDIDEFLQTVFDGNQPQTT